MKRDGYNKSLWQDTKISSMLMDNISDTGTVYDVIIVGAGITGITTGYNLTQQGKKVLILEAQTVGFGTTGGTTAHLNTFFDISYDKVIEKFGLDDAKLFAESGAEAMQIIKNNIDNNVIDCSYKKCDAYMFSLDKEQSKDLAKVVDGSNKVGVEMTYVNENPYPIPFDKIALMRDNAQFNPILYIHGLLPKYLEMGGKIMENCTVTGMDDGDVIEVETTKGKIKCHNLIYATHTPPGVNQLHFELKAYRSYVIAVTLRDGKYPDALGYDMSDPYRYYRSQELNGKKYLIVGGEDHKTGDAIDTDECFQNLEEYVSQYFEVDEVAYKWSSQYYAPADGLPYIGKMTVGLKNVYVATGFEGIGMILGTIAASIVCDLICGKDSKYQKLFDPLRVKPVAGFAKIVENAADTIGNFTGITVEKEKIEALAEVSTGQGKLVKYEGKTVGVYRDENNGVHMIDPTCSHIHCTVAWNCTEKSWDCPCHGARFDTDGAMLNGPARRDLETL